MLLAHGYGEHFGRYEHVAARLVRLGLAVVAPDHRGHGRSEGRRGHVARFGHFVDDLELVRTQIVAPLAKGRPQLLVGHSMGGLLAVHHLLHFPGVFRAAAISSPALGLPEGNPPRVLRFLARILSVLWPTAPFKGNLDPGDLSRDASVGRAYAADPLVHGIATPRFFVQLSRAIDEAQRRAGEITTPLLVMQGGADRLVDPAGTAAFAARLPKGRNRAIVHPGLFHEIFNELAEDRETVLVDLERWLGDALAEPG